MCQTADEIKQLLEPQVTAITILKPLLKFRRGFQLDVALIIKTKKLELAGKEITEPELACFILPFVIEHLFAHQRKKYCLIFTSRIS